MVSASAYAVLNVAVSVALVLVNKRVFAGGFHFPMTLSFFHFLFTIAWYKMLEVGGTFTMPAPGTMPAFEKFKVAGAVFSSIGFMNLSLNANSIGFYQVTKLTVVPVRRTFILRSASGAPFPLTYHTSLSRQVTLAINSLAYANYTTTKVKISLFILLAGVGVATVSEVHLKPLGLAYGVIAVVMTAVCQIWQGSKQKEFGISATQLQATLAPWMSAQAFAVAMASEVLCSGGGSGSEVTACDAALPYFKAALLDGDPIKSHTLLIVLGTCFLALLVNLSSFGLVGLTSAITLQVVGHAKTCLVLIGGYVLFPSHGNSKHQQQQLQNNIIGVSVAMVGVVLYGHFKHAAGLGQPDLFDNTCPGCVLRVIEPSAAEEAPESKEGLTAAEEKA